MSETAPVRVGSWVTVKAASTRVRDRREAQTPGLVTAINIEGLGCATVLYPNPLALQCGFRCRAWKRCEAVPFEEMKAHDRTPALDAAMWTALRLGRASSASSAVAAGNKKESFRFRPLKRELSPLVARREARQRKLRSQRQTPDNGTHTGEDGAEAAAAGAEERKHPGLRRWMKPGSVWSAPVDVLANVRVPPAFQWHGAEDTPSETRDAYATDWSGCLDAYTRKRGRRTAPASPSSPLKTGPCKTAARQAASPVW